MSDEDDTCPLCIEEIDITDRYFKPCPCGYRICRFCWNSLIEEYNPKCPACRAPYSLEAKNYPTIPRDELEKYRAERKRKEKEKKEQILKQKKPPNSTAVVQRNHIYVTGLPQNIMNVEILRSMEYFRQFGKITRINIGSKSVPQTPLLPNIPTTGVHITYVKKENAAKALEQIDGCYWNDTCIRATYGVTKYCSYFLKNQPCKIPNCSYAHEQGEDPEVVLKEELIRSQNHEKLRKALPFYISSPGDKPKHESIMNSRNIKPLAKQKSYNIVASGPSASLVGKPRIKEPESKQNSQPAEILTLLPEAKSPVHSKNQPWKDIPQKQTNTVKARSRSASQSYSSQEDAHETLINRSAISGPSKSLDVHIHSSDDLQINMDNVKQSSKSSAVKQQALSDQQKIMYAPSAISSSKQDKQSTDKQEKKIHGMEVRPSSQIAGRTSFAAVAGKGSQQDRQTSTISETAPKLPKGLNSEQDTPKPSLGHEIAELRNDDISISNPLPDEHQPTPSNKNNSTLDVSPRDTTEKGSGNQDDLGEKNSAIQESSLPLIFPVPGIACYNTPKILESLNLCVYPAYTGVLDPFSNDATSMLSSGIVIQGTLDEINDNSMFTQSHKETQYRHQRAASSNWDNLQASHNGSKQMDPGSIQSFDSFHNGGTANGTNPKFNPHAEKYPYHNESVHRSVPSEFDQHGKNNNFKNRLNEYKGQDYPADTPPKGANFEPDRVWPEISDYSKPPNPSGLQSMYAVNPWDMQNSNQFDDVSHQRYTKCHSDNVQRTADQGVLCQHRNATVGQILGNQYNPQRSPYQRFPQADVECNAPFQPAVKPFHRGYVDLPRQGEEAYAPQAHNQVHQRNRSVSNQFYNMRVHDSYENQQIYPYDVDERNLPAVEDPKTRIRMKGESQNILGISENPGLYDPAQNHPQGYDVQDHRMAGVPEWHNNILSRPPGSKFLPFTREEGNTQYHH